jgi:hypothetical protein
VPLVVFVGDVVFNGLVNGVGVFHAQEGALAHGEFRVQVFD